MGFLDDAIGSAVPGGKVGKPLMLALLALLASGALFRGGGSEAVPSPRSAPSQDPADEGGGLLGGLGGLLERFQRTGQGKVIDSWIGHGPNEPVSPGQLGNTLGSEVIKNLAARSGMSEDELIRQLSQVLPGIVDKLTPNGRLPTAKELLQP